MMMRLVLLLLLIWLSSEFRVFAQSWAAEAGGAPCGRGAPSAIGSARTT